jgi:hypothetical protein
MFERDWPLVSDSESVEIAATSRNCDPAQIAVSLADVTCPDHPLDFVDSCLPSRRGDSDRRNGLPRSRSSIFAINAVPYRERRVKIVGGYLAPACSIAAAGVVMTTPADRKDHLLPSVRLEVRDIKGHFSCPPPVTDFLQGKLCLTCSDCRSERDRNGPSDYRHAHSFRRS